jgi:hypothetical protein
MFLGRVVGEMEVSGGKGAGNLHHPDHGCERPGQKASRPNTCDSASGSVRLGSAEGPWQANRNPLVLDLAAFDRESAGPCPHERRDNKPLPYRAGVKVLIIRETVEHPAWPLNVGPLCLKGAKSYETSNHGCHSRR